MVRLLPLFAFGLPLLACTGLAPPPEDTADTPEPDPEEDVPAPVAILLVIDTSASMQDTNASLLLGLDEVVASLDGLDWQLGVTTTSVDWTSGASGDVEPGEAGTLSGPVATSAELDALRRTLACDTIYWKDSDLESDPSYEGGADCVTPAEVSREYLDCLCPDGWVEDSGSGQEEGLEAVAAALCRGVADAPSACWDADSPLTAADEGSVDLWRDGARRAAWIVSDEGDSSRRVTNGEDAADTYTALFDALGGVQVSVAGPWYEDLDGTCLDGAQTWGVGRYQDAADETGGAYEALTYAPDRECAERDVSVIVAAFGAALAE